MNTPNKAENAAILDYIKGLDENEEVSIFADEHALLINSPMLEDFKYHCCFSQEDAMTAYRNVIKTDVNINII